MSEQLTDQALVEKAQQGDKKAFNLLVARHQNKVAGLLTRYVSANDIPDVVQETFIKAYRSLELFRGDSAFYTWLYRIAVNTAKNYLTAQGRRPPSEDIQAEDAETYDAGDSLRNIDTPENLILSSELKKIVFETIAALPEELKTSITLRELEGLSYEEIAEIMDCPVGTVRSRIFRAREIIDSKISPLINNER
ncbi:MULTISPECIES: RNA polymerase sigma factor RpoE [Testudinibacter]|uniref:RNA polymerase sigma factor n=1 Tax=Testudinibacter aquarius TaxID=1524974 RepID=A0A4R3YC21_9PAST|nr:MULTISPECIES: RNA polymerase sigma factor RpoE [Testudinibacter]TNG96591.1 RNA polymerase sigma factor RpoE [Pasteurellaceae bacterium UScroc12]TNG98247.1 RNA polymerase sigma factor RpoE [Pasteurellaceae bacterium USgator41]TNG99423.1 RNA polymerase sigma factor RpoE [Pasteurellaceae bacterium USgator11]TNH01813.1 RNA polymerase sigma factor RpoE [Pasteurellaceae bacterium UScroc31]TNH05308.1 RNA polymerase sigma factor RpoE [Pasteurellaceae bacterium Phil31]TNH09243.1 RNA polymerase sigm